MKLYKIKTKERLIYSHYVESELDIKELISSCQLVNGFVGFDVVHWTNFWVPNTSIEGIIEIEYDEEINNTIAKNKEKERLKCLSNKIEEDFSIENLSEKDLVNMLTWLNTKKDAVERLEFTSDAYNYVSYLNSEDLNTITSINIIFSTVDYNRTNRGLFTNRVIAFKKLTEEEANKRLPTTIKIGKYKIYYPTYGMDISLQKLFQVIFVLWKESLEQEVKK